MFLYCTIIMQLDQMNYLLYSSILFVLRIKGSFHAVLSGADVS